MRKTLQTNRAGLCLRSLPSEQDRAQQREGKQTKRSVLVHVQSSEAVGGRQGEPPERKGQGEGRHRSPARVRAYLPVRQAPLALLCPGKLLDSLSVRCDLSAYNCSPVGNIFQTPQTLFSLSSFSTAAAAFTAAPYLYAQKSSWIAQTAKKNQWIFEFKSKFWGHLCCDAFNIHALKIYLCKWILRWILNVRKVELHILL